MENKKRESARSVRTKDFMEAYQKLNADERKLANAAFKNWQEDTTRVDFKALAQTNNLFWGAKVSDGLRAVARKTKDSEGKNCYVWCWIGSREGYTEELKRLNASKKINDIVNRMRGDTSQHKVPKARNG